MHDFIVIMTWEALYDISDIEDYIEETFGKHRAVLFEEEIYNEIADLGNVGLGYSKTDILYRGNHIYKKPVPPSVIFYVQKEKEIHVLRVLREERNWHRILNQSQKYTYPE